MWEKFCLRKVYRIGLINVEVKWMKLNVMNIMVGNVDGVGIKKIIMFVM